MELVLDGTNLATSVPPRRHLLRFSAFADEAMIEQIRYLQAQKPFEPFALEPGQQFGRLTIILPMRDGRWLAECQCGNLVALYCSDFKRRTGCGCSHSGWINKHPLYSVYTNIKTRCYNPRGSDYCWYGGRGIRMCERWRNSFAAFVADIESTIGPKPGPEYSIDRINNGGDYHPGNVKWSTAKEQAGNRRKPQRGLIKATSIIVGETNLTEACRRAGLCYESVRRRIIATSESPLEAINHFVQRRSLGLSAKRHLINGLTLAEACRRASVAYSSVHARMKKFSETPVEAISHFQRMERARKIVGAPPPNES